MKRDEMPEPQAFHGSTRTTRPRDRRLATLAGGLLVAFLALAIAKPWAQPVSDDGETPVPSGAPALVPPPSLQTTGPEVVPVAAPTSLGPLPVAFTTDAAPRAAATWTALRWTRLAPDDPRALLTSIVRWRGGFVAVGRQAAIPTTPVWTSRDGRHWNPLLPGTDATFWPELAVLAVAAVPAGLVALTEARAWCANDCAAPYILPVISWTSPDGRHWTPHLLPPEWFAVPEGVAPVVAAGTGGLLVALPGPSPRVAVSADGVRWELGRDALPAGFVLDDLAAAPAGFVAAGRWSTGGSEAEGATLWSPDGRRWSSRRALVPGSPDLGSAGRTTLVDGEAGVIAIAEGGSAPAAPTWWRSADGREWQRLEGYPPLGAWSPSGSAIRSGPHGIVVADGRRMLALRGVPGARAWTSADGLAWTPLGMLGDVPPASAMRAALLETGVVVSDGASTWYGQAIVR